MKFFVSILLLILLCIGCETTILANQSSAVVAGAEEKYVELLEKGIQTLSNGNSKEAIDVYFNPIIEYYNNEYKDYDKRVYCARISAETLAYLNESINRNEMAIVIQIVWTQALYYKSYANFELGNIEEAITTLKKALELSPSNSYYLSELGHYYQVEHKWDEAAKLFEKAEESAIKYSPEDLKNNELARALRGSAYILIELGRFDEAEDKYRKCLELDKNDKTALNEIEYIKNIQNKIQEYEKLNASANEADTKIKKKEISVEEIISYIRDIYQTTNSYYDSGVVKSIFYTDFNRSKLEFPFTTAFIRPEKFRFEFDPKSSMSSDNLLHHIVWADGNDIYTWMIVGGAKKEASINTAVASAAGISSGSSVAIPALLMPRKINAFKIIDLKNMFRLGDAVIGDVLCYRIQGKSKVTEDKIITLWISKKTYLIHRIESSRRYKGSMVEDTTSYNPETDIAIEKNKLDFNAPEIINTKLNENAR
jgi:tetratricopeptide (TPR) repeat protein